MTSIDDLFHHAQERSLEEANKEEANKSFTPDTEEEAPDDIQQLMENIPLEFIQRMLNNLTAHFMDDSDIEKQAEHLLERNYSPEFVAYLKKRTYPSLNPKKIKHINLNKEKAATYRKTKIGDIHEYLAKIQPIIEHYEQSVEYIRTHVDDDQDDFLKNMEPTEIGPQAAMMDHLLVQLDMLKIVKALIAYIEKQ